MVLTHHNGTTLNKKENNAHAEEVDLWIQKTIKDRPIAEQIQTFSEAILSLKNRITVTLSLATWNVILDRSLLQSQVLYPVLKIVGVETGIIVSGKDSEKGEANLQDVTLALRYFLIELITILDSLTSAILTNAIYAELDKISAAKKSGTNLGKS